MHSDTLGLLTGQCNLSVAILRYFKNQKKRFLSEKRTNNGPAFNNYHPSVLKLLLRVPGHR